MEVAAGGKQDRSLGCEALYLTIQVRREVGRLNIKSPGSTWLAKVPFLSTFDLSAAAFCAAGSNVGALVVLNYVGDKR